MNCLLFLIQTSISLSPVMLSSKTSQKTCLCNVETSRDSSFQAGYNGKVVVSNSKVNNKWWSGDRTKALFYSRGEIGQSIIPAASRGRTKEYFPSSTTAC